MTATTEELQQRDGIPAATAAGTNGQATAATAAGTGRTERPCDAPAATIAVSGIADIGDERGFLRVAGYRRSAGDIPLTAAQVRQYGLRKGDHVQGTAAPRHGDDSKNAGSAGRSGARTGNSAGNGTRTRSRGGAGASDGMTLVSVETINGMPPQVAKGRPRFDDLTPVYPNQRFRLEDGDPSATARIIDLVSPIGKGQRGLIVAPPKAGKTMVLKTIAHAIASAYPDVHLMLVLVGERPEEVTDLRRSVRGEVISATFDQAPEEHVRAAELAIERAKRLAELGTDVVVLLDSLTRLGRAYNLAAPASSRTLSGGVAASALQPPRQFLGAARCLEEGGSVTIVSTALIDTGSQLDTVLFEEFKGTGNMELRLRRDLAEKRIFPAIDVAPSGTRREDLLMMPAEHAAVVSLRRALAALDSQHALELLIDKTSQGNEQFLRQVRHAN